MPLESPWLTTKEVADYAKRHVNSVNDALRAGELKGSQPKPNGRWIVHRDDVDAWLRGTTANTPVPIITRARKTA